MRSMNKLIYFNEKNNVKSTKRNRENNRIWIIVSLSAIPSNLYILKMKMVAINHLYFNKYFLAHACAEYLLQKFENFFFCHGNKNV